MSYSSISRRAYAETYYPTVGDRVRLADTELIIEKVEGDYTTYGDKVKFGGSKVIRDGMGSPVKKKLKQEELDTLKLAAEKGGVRSKVSG